MLARCLLVRRIQCSYHNLSVNCLSISAKHCPCAHRSCRRALPSPSSSDPLAALLHTASTTPSIQDRPHMRQKLPLKLQWNENRAMVIQCKDASGTTKSRWMHNRKTKHFGEIAASLSEARNTLATFKMCSVMMALIVMMRDRITILVRHTFMKFSGV